MVNKEVYPITAAVERSVTNGGQPIKNFPPGAKLCKAAQEVIDTLGEYEHGTADVEDVFQPVLEEFGLMYAADKLAAETPDPEAWFEQLCLKLYAAAATDIALVLHNVEE